MSCAPPGEKGVCQTPIPRTDKQELGVWRGFWTPSPDPPNPRTYARIWGYSVLACGVLAYTYRSGLRLQPLKLRKADRKILPADRESGGRLSCGSRIFHPPGGFYRDFWNPTPRFGAVKPRSGLPGAVKPRSSRWKPRSGVPPRGSEGCFQTPDSCLSVLWGGS